MHIDHRGDASRQRLTSARRIGRCRLDHLDGVANCETDGILARLQHCAGNHRSVRNCRPVGELRRGHQRSGRQRHRSRPADDSIWTAAAYLCGTAGRIKDVRAAVLTYNHSAAYADKVLAKAAIYGSAISGGSVSPGGLVCPVSAPIRHSDDWHAPRSGGRQHQGNDLFAPYGTVLVAIESGVVDKSSDTESGLGGITLWIRGDSGTRWYYAHNSRNFVTKGTRVEAAQPVALLGNTGDARTTTPHLHFEMHPGGGDASSPFALISRICARPT